ncbi:protein-methionine-sulfoxide reductase heme-binding subunit MsrQ [Gaopeijia maritima]|uniref:Protein-methionine-sulfoxide reductase heme-binding subunit MsrQ n=1 Tax=Gaopeijia maritima TaxID=3119007 RepID=A0ABU9EEN5_9BACT
MNAARARIVALKTGVWLACLVPLAWSIWRFARGEASVDPVEEWLHRSGKTAVIILVISLAVTPVRRLTGWNGAQKFRRLLGLFAFFYAVLHVAVYLYFEQGLAWSFILEDVTERPFIVSGTVAFLLLVPLALSSTRGSIRRLGRSWARLHKLVYLAMAAVLLHYVWGQKADIRDPLIVAGIVVLLLGVRLYYWGRKRAARAAAAEG